MIDHADVSIADDGDVLVLIPPAGIDPDRLLALAFPDGALVLSQDDRTLVRIPGASTREAILNAHEVSVMEIGEEGFLALHTAVEVNRA